MTLATPYAIRKYTLREAEVHLRMTKRECPVCGEFVREFQLSGPHWNTGAESPRRLCPNLEPERHMLKRVWRGDDWRWGERE